MVPSPKCPTRPETVPKINPTAWGLGPAQSASPVEDPQIVEITAGAAAPENDHAVLHRVVDGAEAARFLHAIVGILEDPVTLLGI